jgi:hypothetical protein
MDRSVDGPVDHPPARACSSCGAPEGRVINIAGLPARLCAGCLAVTVDRARARLRGAQWIGGCFLAFGLAIGMGGAIFTALSDRPPGELTPTSILVIASLEGLVTAYSAWSLFWGVPAAVRWWMGLSETVARRLGPGTSLLPVAPSS